MVEKVVLLSGPIASGKTSLRQSLKERFDVFPVITGEGIRQRFPKANRVREEYQKLGDRLDRRKGVNWVLADLEKVERNAPDGCIIVVDSVRIQRQIDEIRNAYGRRVIHIHLSAPKEVLASRYQTRASARYREVRHYDQLQANKTERNISKLAQNADVVIDTNMCSPADVFVRAAAHIGFYGRNFQRSVDVLVGGQYGSEGKGHIAHYLAPEYQLLIRVGGPNAGHTVYSPRYTFHSLPSGTGCSPSSRLLIGPGAVVFVPTLLREIADCHVDKNRLSIDPQVMLITNQDIRKESVLRDTIASTASGAGAAQARRIMGRSKSVKLAKDEKALRPFIKESCAVLDDAYARGDSIFLEGTQGTGLSLFHGQYPHVTSRDTTVTGCLAESGISSSRVRKVVMVCRSYPIRVQDPAADGLTSGPMSREVTWATVAERSGIPEDELKKAEVTSTTGRQRRVAEFDWYLLRKAASLNAPTDIALTFVDYLAGTNKRARRFEQLKSDTIRFIEEIERVACAPVTLISTRFHERSIIDRRAW
ncbi:MAG: adenylosuccinate synthetase [candidate division Zixibacteria bacterium]|jgi:adenylosuccinate synthase|nr:adenylosuccinate synthetase [candidate division Zixibacteria bacterium]